MAKVVVVDDEAGICRYIAMRLTSDGHDVRTSGTGHEAIDLAYLFEPDVLVTDWRLMNEYDGLEVCEAMRHVNPQLKTILITAFASEDLSGRLKQFPVFALVHKPVSLDLISRLVQEAMDEQEN